jgi:hypothetical protein
MALDCLNHRSSPEDRAFNAARNRLIEAIQGKPLSPREAEALGKTLAHLPPGYLPYLRQLMDMLQDPTARRHIAIGIDTAPRPIADRCLRDLGLERVLVASGPCLGGL